MKFFSLEIIAIFSVVISIVFAGCTDSTSSVPSATPQITATAMKTTGIPSIAAARQPATTVQVTATERPVRIFYGEYHWVEYRLNSSTTMTPNPRSSWEYTIRMEQSRETYKDNPAIHYRITTISDYPECCIDNIATKIKDGRVSVEDSYYDASTDKLLGETYSETIKGVLQSPENYTAYYSHHKREDGPAGEMGITPFGEMNITLIDLGTESVTVPAGTYPEARKYSGKFHDGTPITFWIAPGVPVPVRYEFPYKEMEGVDPFQSYELKGWG